MGPLTEATVNNPSVSATEGNGRNRENGPVELIFSFGSFRLYPKQQCPSSSAMAGHFFFTTSQIFPPAEKYPARQAIRRSSPVIGQGTRAKLFPYEKDFRRDSLSVSVARPALRIWPLSLKLQLSGDGSGLRRGSAEVNRAAR